MTTTMISDPDDAGRASVSPETATRAAHARDTVTALFAGTRRALEELGTTDRQWPRIASEWFAAAEPSRPTRSARHQAKPDLSTPTGRVLHGYLGEGARRAIADLLDTLDGEHQLPLGLLSMREATRQALRLAVVDEPARPLDDEDQAADMWSVPCLDCGAEAQRACMGVPSGTHVHGIRMFGVLLIAVSDQPEVCELVDQARRKATTAAVPSAADVALVASLRGVL
jgi:hypothetical protein